MMLCYLYGDYLWIMLYKTESQILCTWHKAEEDETLQLELQYFMAKIFYWVSNHIFPLINL
jgi:hypothetical protein